MKVKMYGKTECPNCDKAKTLIKMKSGIELEYINIEEAGIDAAKLAEICGRPVRQVPQIFVNDEYVGSLNEFIPVVMAHK